MFSKNISGKWHDILQAYAIMLLTCGKPVVTYDNFSNQLCNKANYRF